MTYEIALYLRGAEVTAPGYHRTRASIRVSRPPDYAIDSDGIKVGPFDGPGFWADWWEVVDADGDQWGGASPPCGASGMWFGSGVSLTFTAGPLLRSERL